MTVKVIDANRLMDNARVQLAGALDGAIWQEMFNVFSDFCNRTDVWYEDLVVTITGPMARGATVEITPETGGRPNRLLYVLNSDGTQRRMSMPTPGTLMFIDSVDMAQNWTARVALSVADPIPTTGVLKGIPQLPDWMLEKYHIGLLAGVVGTMMTHVGKPYTNPTMAKFHLTKYMNAVSEGKNDARRQNLQGGQSWSFPQNFASVSGAKGAI